MEEHAAVAESLGALALLPDCVISYILSRLDARSLVKVACASKVLRVWSCEEAMWQALALAGFEGPLVFQVRRLDDRADACCCISCEQRTPMATPQ
jgi:hypothetical protein